VLLEGNANWCADVYQSLCGKPLGHTPFVNILAERFRNLESCAIPSASLNC